MRPFRLATFRFDVTPPVGHPLCGGWITPAKQVEDRLEAIGFVLLGAGDPIVVCALDWTGLLNSAHLQWRQALADAAGTHPDRVAIHCVHQHDAPLVCLDSQRIAQSEANMLPVCQPKFVQHCLEQGRRAVEQALSAARPSTHVAHAQAKVSEVASYRRISRDEVGRVIAERRSFCRDPQLCALPDGLIDPWLKTIAFYDQDQPIVMCHYYATHPQSFYGEGRVSSDFVGLARKRFQAEGASCAQIYFTGCAGNISAGKYNDGSEASRQRLTDRLYDAMTSSSSQLTPEPIQQVNWRCAEIVPCARDTLTRAVLVEQLSNCYYAPGVRGRAAFMLSWLDRVEQGTGIPLSVLSCNQVDMLYLPGECFVEYQLRAQQFAPTRFVAAAAYGDGGPWYIPTSEEYDKGGYELTSTFCPPEMDGMLTKAMEELLC